MQTLMIGIPRYTARPLPDGGFELLCDGQPADNTTLRGDEAAVRGIVSLLNAQTRAKAERREYVMCKLDQPDQRRRYIIFPGPTHRLN